MNAWQTIAAETRAEYERFIAACADTERTQFECLFAILGNNANSEAGKRLDFKSVKSIDDFRARLPIVTYDDLADDIEAQSCGTKALCAEPVRFYEQTGGSTGGAKLVPFTASALTAMHRAVEPWLSDLLENRPAVGEGLSYWSISPALSSPRTTADGTTIGSGSDLAFIREELQPAFAATLASPPDLASMVRFADWQLATLLCLLMQDKLRLISIWSPSFLTTLMTAMIEQSDRLIAALHDPRAAGQNARTNSVDAGRQAGPASRGCAA